MTAGRLTLGVLLAVALPAVILHLSAPDRHSHGLTAAPFATPRLLVAHLAMAVPLGLMLAVWIGRSDWATRQAGLLARVGLAALATASGVLAARATGHLLADAGFAPHAVARSLLAVGLVTPWLFVGLGRGHPGDLRRRHLAVGGLLALMPLAVYADRLMDAQARTFTTYQETGRFVRARGMLDGLTDLGAAPPSAAATRADERKKLDREIRGLTEAVRLPLPADAGPAVRLTRGFALIQLDRLAEAEAVLAPLVGSDASAALVLAAVYRDQERWDEAEALSRRALDSLDPGNADQLATAYDGWAEAARGAGRPEDAEKALREALDRLPDRAAYYHLRLGRHLHDGGRPVPALDHLAEAVRLDPVGHGKQAQDVIDQIRRMTPACVLSGH